MLTMFKDINGKSEISVVNRKLTQSDRLEKNQIKLLNIKIVIIKILNSVVRYNILPIAKESTSKIKVMKNYTECTTESEKN